MAVGTGERTDGTALVEAAAELSASMGVSMEEATRALLGVSNAFGIDYEPPKRWLRGLMWLERKLGLPRTNTFARGIQNGFILGNLVGLAGVTVFALLYLVVT